MRALVLAAGVGSRLGSLTANRPKPMLEIGGRPILESNVRLLVRYGFDDLVVNLHHQPNVIRDYFGDGAAFGARIRYSFEPELLGTAGALLPNRSFWSDTFAVVYGDNLSTCNLAAMLQLHRETDALVTVAVFEREDVSASGVASFGPDLAIRAFVEKPPPEAEVGHWVNAGVLMCQPAVLEFVGNPPVDFGRDVLPSALAAGRRLTAYRMQNDERLWWVDTQADYQKTSLAVTAKDLA